MTGPRTRTVTAILQVARMAALDLLRRPGTWTTTILTGALFAVLFAGVGITTTRLQERAERISFSIAVDGDLDGAKAFLSSLATDRLIIRPADDAAAWVTSSRATAGLTLPPGFDDRLARGDVTEVKVYYRGASAGSQEALNSLLLRMQAVERSTDRARALTSAVAASSPPAPVGIEASEVKEDPRTNRDRFAAGLAAMACILCMGTVSTVTGVFGRSQEQRTLEPLLLLPLRRGHLTVGLALGAFPVAVLQLLSALVIVIGTTALPVAGLQQPLDQIGRILVLGLLDAVALGLLATAAGSLAGAIGTGTDDAVSLGDFFSIPFIASGVVLFLLPDVATTLPLAGAPIMAPAVALRDAIRGEIDLPFLAVATLATVGWCTLLVLGAGHRVADERRLLRATR